MKKKSVFLFKTVASAILMSSLALTLPFNENVQKAEASGQVWNFYYTGNYQTWTVPYTGKYQLETWGAQGGNGLNTTGGNGGYSKGEVILQGGEPVYIYVGGQGSQPTAGWNGGGAGGLDSGSGQTGGGGGGATDIRLSTNLQSRLIVAGGGAGGGRDGRAGIGGGLSGTASESYSSGYPGQPGTQNGAGNAYYTSRGATNGSLGVGGRGSTGYNSAGGGGGGGGYYGGGGGTSTQDHGSGWSAGGGGGSGYIGNLQNTQILAGNQTFLSPSGGNEVGHSGHGYARITQLNSAPTVTVSSPTSGSKLNAGTALRVIGSVTDSEATGTLSTYYSIDNGTESLIWNQASTGQQQIIETNIPISFDMSYGTHNLQVWAKDSEGAVSTKVTVPFFIQDISKPSLTHNLSNSSLSKESAIITVTATDKGSGIKRVKLPNGNYVSSSVVNYTASKNGKYTFIAEDNEGNTETYTVDVDNIYEDLVLEAEAKLSDNSINLKWNNPFGMPTTYVLHRKNENGEWESIPSKSTVKVLNIYPDLNVPNTGLSGGQIDLDGKSVPNSGILKTWLLKEGIDDVDIDTISLSSFNNNPSAHLNKQDELWNYDAIFYGMWNLPPDTVYPNDNAVEYIRDFIGDGGGFMTSHHTIGYRALDRGVNKLAPELGVEIFSNQPYAKCPAYSAKDTNGNMYPTVSFELLEDVRCDYSSYWPTGTKVEIAKKGLLTENPFKVGEIGQQYTIPSQHGLNVFGKGDVWMKTVNPTGFVGMPFKEINVSPRTGEVGTNNFYVHTYNNTAIINSGHSFPSISEAETRIIANTLYYLAQTTTDTEWTDRSGMDTAPPKQPVVNMTSDNADGSRFSLSSEDLGTPSEFLLKARNSKFEVQSNVARAELKTGIAGYSYVVDTNPNTIPDNIVEETGDDILVPINTEFYLHVVAVDKAGNKSPATHYRYVDNVSPTLNLSTNNEEGWRSRSVEITATASDSHSGIKRIKLPNGNYVSENTAVYSVHENGTYTFSVEDNFGNMTTKSVSITNIDKTKPTVSHALNKSELTSGEVVLTLNASDSQSGMKSIIDVDEMENGLTGTYRQHTIPSGTTPPVDLGSTIFERVDKTISFSWGSDSPDPRLPVNGYNVTWSGYIKSPVSGEVTFETNTDDGARLKIGDNLLIEKWIQQSPTKYRTTIAMVKDEWYPITMDYYENTGGSTAELRWSHEGTNGFEIVPENVLYTGGETEGSRLVKSVEQNGEFMFLAEDNVGNIKPHEVKIANITYKPELQAIPNHEEDYVSLDWNIADKWQNYSYMIYKKKATESEYQTIPAKEKVKMLNIYPNVGAPITFTNWQGETFTVPQSAQAKMWLEKPNNEHDKGYGKGLIDTDVISLTEFNANPNAYLKNPDGTWKYDVVYTGSWDCYGYCSEQGDFSLNSAEALKGFIQSGRGYLTGHDTIWRGHPNMNSLREYGKIQLGVGIDMPDTKTTGSTEIVIDKKGLLTNYPWEIGTPGTTLTIPYTHTSQQFANGDVWLRFNTPDFNGTTGAKGNFYLTTWSNMAMIQLGHSNGQATPDEQKVLANTIFYLAQTTSANSWKDHSSQDVDAPNKPTIQNVIADGLNEKVKVNFTGVTDKGTSYDYYVEATGDKNHVKTNSDVESATVLSGLEGYSYVIDNNPNTTPDNVVDTTDTNFTVNKAINSNFYVHVVAIDKVGNVSDVSHYHYEDKGAPILNVDVSPTSWTKGTVLLTASASDNETAIRRIQLPDNSWVNGANANYTVQNNGTYAFVAEDFVGNKTTKTVTVTNIDKTAPTTPIINNNEDWVKAESVAVIIQAGNDSLSGVAYTEYRLSGATNAGWTRYNGTFHVSNEGETFVHARTVDKVGIASSESTSVVRIDRSAPYNMGITIKLKP